MECSLLQRGANHAIRALPAFQQIKNFNAVPIYSELKIVHAMSERPTNGKEYFAYP